MSETIFERTLREFQERLLSGNLDKSDKTRINNFIARYPSKKWTFDDVVKTCMDNEKFCARMAKDAMKQNLDEKQAIVKIDAEKLPAGGKANIRFTIDTGNLVVGAKAGFNLTKSADFKMEYKGQTIYGSQKTIHGQGGHQTTQIREAIEFVRAGNKQYHAIAVIDGVVVNEPHVYTSDEIVEKKNNNADIV